MKKLSFFTLIFLFFVSHADEGDIVVSKIINSKEYSIDQNSYCRDRTPVDNLNWSEEFEEESLSKSTWKYAVSNGFVDRGEYISGWGNGELQYYTKPSKKKTKTNTSKNLLIEDGVSAEQLDKFDDEATAEMTRVYEIARDASFPPALDAYKDVQDIGNPQTEAF